MFCCIGGALLGLMPGGYFGLVPGIVGSIFGIVGDIIIFCHITNKKPLRVSLGLMCGNIVSPMAKSRKNKQLKNRY